MGLFCEKEADFSSILGLLGRLEGLTCAFELLQHLHHYIFEQAGGGLHRLDLHRLEPTLYEVLRAVHKGR